MSDSHALSRPFPARAGRSRRGQSLVELALVLPILLVLTTGIVQVGTVIATKHTLTQIGRDVGRWAATQPADPCDDIVNDNQPWTRADQIALESGLMGYSSGTWSGASFTHHPDEATLRSTQPTGPGVEVAWQAVSGTCPPEDSTMAAFVTIRLAHEAPVLLPGLDLVLAHLPPLGNNGTLLITTTAQFRMEPEAEPAGTP
jgi:hypothetical protein